MTAYARREITGGAVATTLSSGIASGDLAFTIASPTGWPTGGVGDFFVVIDRGTANEEKILCASRSGTSVTVQTAGRGVDGSSAVAHSSGATVEHCLFARDADEANLAVSKTLSKATAVGQILVVDAANSFAAVQGKTSGQLLMGNGTTVASLAMSGDVTIDGTGATTIGSAKITAGKIAVGGVSASNQFAAGVVDSAAVAAAIKDAAAGTASLRTLSTTSTTACAGNDSRLSDTRTPSVGSVTQNTMATGLRAHNVTSSIAPSSPVAGDLWFAQTNNTLNVYNGTDWVCLTPQSASVAANEAIGSTGSYVNLTTVGPAVSLQTGTKALVTLSSAFNSTQNPDVNLGFTVSGATTLAASDANCAGPFTIVALANGGGARTFLLTGLTGGVNTFTMRYKSTSSTATTAFLRRDITVVGIPG